ncbi:MAG TPA: glycosyltransferase family 2 protein [Gemmatimonadaceae bacterium]|nr:glycosyltransferase family 2 protein [Gemmatimonadaceae bacterium]
MARRRDAASTTSLIIATYNWKEALAAVLATVRAQWELPAEVLVADDGSGADTAELIAREARTFPAPLGHVWHEDAGFRLGTIRNKAMAVARGEYLIQLDGDLLLHPAFVRSHRRFAERGAYVQGSRAMLDAAATARCLAVGRLAVRPWSPGVRNRANAIYAPLLARVVRGPRDALTRTRGANMAFWRDDVVRVNGYNEAIEGWGREDSELAARLQNAGVRRRNLKFAAVAWHLHHRARAQDAVDRNHEIFERTLRERLVWCEEGIGRHLEAAKAGGLRG